MSTRSGVRNFFPPLDNPKLTIRRRSRVDPTLLNDFEMAIDGNGDPPIPYLRTMEELCQPTLNGRGGTFIKRRPEECYELIKSMTAHHNDWDTSAQRSESSSSITSSSDLEIVALKATVGQTQNKYAAGAYQGGNSYKPQGNRNLLSYRSDNYLGPLGFNQNHNQNNQNQNIQNQNWNQGNNHAIPQGNNQGRNQFFQGASHGQNPPPAYQAPAYHAPGYHLRFMKPQFLNLERETKVTKDMGPPTNNGGTKDVQPLVVQIETLKPNSEPVVSLVAKPVIGRALIDVYAGELTLRVNNEVVTFNLDQTSRYSANYNDMTANRIDVIDMACEEYTQEVLSFSNMIGSGNPTPYYDTIVSTSSPTLTPFGDSDFLLEEVEAFLALEDYPTSVEVELKDLPPHLEYAFLEGDDKLPVIIAKDLSVEEKAALIKVLKTHKRAIAWKLSDIKGINSKFFTNKILMEDDFKPTVQHERRSLGKPRTLRTKKGGFTIVENEENELTPTRLVTGWQVCIDYCKLNEATRKDHFPLPFMDQMLERLAGNKYYFFLDGFSGYFQIPVDPKDQENTTFTCPYGMFTYRRMPFGLCNEKIHFMVKEGIVLSSKNSKNEIEVDKSKVNVIAKLPHPTTVKGIRSFLGHAGFYRRFIQDFSKIARPMTRLFEKDTPLFFSMECIEAFQTLNRKLTEAPILISLSWDLPFELMCDASDFAIGAVLGKHQEKHFRPIHYASKTMTEAESHYTTMEKEMKPLTFSRLATMDPPGDTMARTTPQKKCLIPVFIGLQSIVMATTWSNLVTLVNVRERFYNGMKCLKISSKFVRFLTFRASISWGRSHLHDGTSVYSWPSITCRNGFK
nr:hypothetical protein [Tanacetum cinerariifolium]